jgi:zinc protease
MLNRRWFSLNWLLLLILAYPYPLEAIPKPERRVLDNGMVLILLERHNLPMVTVNLSFSAGSVYDPAGQEGLANLTNSCLSRGTKRRSATQISQEIDFVGGILSSTASVDFAQLDLTVLSKDVELGFDLLADILLYPTFDAEELKREQEEIVADIINQEDDPQNLAGKAFYKMVYGSHPYWHPAEGTRESVPKLTREQVVGFHQEYYRPNNTVMVVVGDITLNEVNHLLAKYFSEWKPKPVDFPQQKSAPAPGKIQSQLIDKPLTQATILLGHLGISRNNPDYYATYVMNYILGGGGFSSRLLTKIRDDLGLVYNVSSYFHTTLQPGSFQILAQTRNQTASKVVEVILAETKLIRSQSVTDDELSAAKAYITGSFPLKLDTNSKVASYLIYMENYGLGMDYLEKFPEYINKVTKDMVQKAAEKYLFPDNYDLVIVGDQSQINLAP